jgi:N-methylhydantoinase B
MCSPPAGFFGGREGTVNRFAIVREGEESTFKALYGTASLSKFANLQARVGDILAVTQGGGAGYGDPLEREPALVAADVRNGYVTAERAGEDYGVVLVPDTGDPDLAATEHLRADRRAAAPEARERG